MVATFLEVTDDQLDRIRSDKNYYTDEEFAKEVFNSVGRNAVITLVVCRNRNIRDLLRGLAELRRKYKTVTFWNRKHKKFYGGNNATFTNSKK